jgi:hypothetical protein
LGFVVLFVQIFCLGSTFDDEGVEEHVTIKRTWEFLGREVGPACFARLIGIGKPRLYKCLGARVDARYGAKFRDRPVARGINIFYFNLWNQVGETIPDRCPWPLYLHKPRPHFHVGNHREHVSWAAAVHSN